MYKHMRSLWRSFEKKWKLKIYFLKEIPEAEDEYDDHFIYIGYDCIIKMKKLNIDFDKNHFGLKFKNFGIDLEAWYYPEHKAVNHFGMDITYYHPEFKSEFRELFDCIVEYLKNGDAI